MPVTVVGDDRRIVEHVGAVADLDRAAGAVERGVRADEVLITNDNRAVRS